MLRGGGLQASPFAHAALSPDSLTGAFVGLNGSMVDNSNNSKAGYAEAWVDYSSSGNGSGAVNITKGSGFSSPAKAMVGSKLSVAQGFRGLTRQLFLFYQTNGSDITWRIRNEHDVGRWTDPTPLNVGI